MRYWWVNHKQTARQEIEGGYLWSPRREANGARSQFYENLRIANPGDAVLSFSGGWIRHAGSVQEFAYPAPRPDGFETIGAHWANEGWLLPIAWHPLAEPVRPKDRIGEFGAHLPTKYSPISPVTGNGNQKAYLAEIGQVVFELLTGATELEDSQQISAAQPGRSMLARIDDMVQQRIDEDAGLDSTTRQQLILARYGQGTFRSRVLEFGRSCRLTQIENPQLLVASHIKPWRLCSTAAERLDGANGLLLTPHVDRLFDRGLISFGNNGDVLSSPRLDRNDLMRLGLLDAFARGSPPFHEQQVPYLVFHRENVFLR